MSVVVAGACFGDVERGIGAPVVVVRAKPRTFHQRPEPLNRVGVNVAVHIMPRVLDDGMLHDRRDLSVAWILVGHEHRAGRVHVVHNEPLQAIGGEFTLRGWYRHHTAPTFNYPDNRELPGASTAWRAL